MYKIFDLKINKFLTCYILHKICNDTNYLLDATGITVYQLFITNASQ